MSTAPPTPAGAAPAPDPRSRRLRDDLPFRRIALVLSGGGALAAYEAGALRTFEAIGLKPQILAGVSSGALNAVVWLAHGFRAAPLVRAWRRVRGSSIGMRWTMLAWRAAAGFLVVVAGLEMLLAMAGSSELSVARWTRGHADPSARDVATVLDVLAWSVIGAIGVVMLAGARRAEELVARLPRGPESWSRVLGVVLVVVFTAHVATWIMDWPYPHRFSLIALLVIAIFWIAVHPGRAGAWIRRRATMLLPEGGGLGLWGSEGRRRMLIRWMVEGDPRRLLDPSTHLIMSACDVTTGRMHYFVNWRDEEGLFARALERRLGEVTVLETLPSVIDAALASSAIPLLFEPVVKGDHVFVDGGVFSNQPLHAVLADGADAVLVVLLAPAEGPSTGERPQHVVALGFRLLEIANWRDVRSELDGLPASWTRAAAAGTNGDVVPAPVCVVEPDRTLPGGMYGYARANAEELVKRGAEDAWRALERAGWLAPA